MTLDESGGDKQRAAQQDAGDHIDSQQFAKELSHAGILDQFSALK